LDNLEYFNFEILKIEQFPIKDFKKFSNSLNHLKINELNFKDHGKYFISNMNINKNIKKLAIKNLNILGKNTIKNMVKLLFNIEYLEIGIDWYFDNKFINYFYNLTELKIIFKADHPNKQLELQSILFNFYKFVDSCDIFLNY
jgi:hypothetical protein